MCVSFRTIIQTFYFVAFLLQYGFVQNNGEELKGDCDAFAVDFSTITSRLIACLFNHGTPVSYCGWCRDELADLHGVINNRTDISPSGVACVDLLIGSKNVQATHHILKYVSSLWNASYCRYCLAEQVPLYPTFTTMPAGLNPFYRLAAYNNKTLQFFIYLNATLNCVARHLTNTHVHILDVLNFPAVDQVVVNSSVCSTCSSQFEQLSDYYNTFVMQTASDKEINEYSLTPDDRLPLHYSVCLDIQDALNRTQWAWFHLLSCHSKEKIIPGGLLPIMVCVVCLIIFYVPLRYVLRTPVHFEIIQAKRVEPRNPGTMSSRTAFPTTSYGSLTSTSQFGNPRPTTNHVSGDMALPMNTTDEEEVITERTSLLQH